MILVVILLQDGHNNNGYVPYVDYSRDYNPPLGRNSLYSGGLVAAAGGGVMVGGGISPQYLNNVDPRYSATYGNPYLRTSNSSLPPPHVGGGVNHSPNTTNPGMILNNTLNNHHHSNHLSSASSSNSNNSNSNHHNASNNLHHHPPPHHPIPFALRNGAVPQVARSPSTPSPHGTTATVVTTSGTTTVPPPQYIVPSPTQLKPGTLATHV